MGVPALFRWLSQKYPKIVVPVVEDANSKHNPNGVEFDNLYLDMNGIIHPCCHPTDGPIPANEEQMMVAIFEYIDRLFAMVRPRRLLYMAIDGVAPRAKMNQQRSRRFRAAQEARLRVAEEAETEVVEEEEEDDFDRNVITPGTPFMAVVSQAVQYYVVERIHNDQKWKDIKVIFSDATVPGEGEHKIMEYVRNVRMDAAYDPNTQHVIYGLDADLIMLALATHEPHFRVLREDVFTNVGGCFRCGRSGHRQTECPNEPRAGPKPFVLLDVSVLREYLEIELSPTGLLPFDFDFEQAIDDWVFLCFFVGNDFLPHLPSLELREGAVDRLVEIWKRKLPLMSGHMCDNGMVHLDRVQLILDELGTVEREIFERRQDRRAPPEAKRARIGDEEAKDADDAVRLGEAGYRERYYGAKFGTDDSEKIAMVVKSYVEGLCWVMAYYYRGVPSWRWFYPYHYAPLAVDFVSITHTKIDFELGKPFRPYDQLLSVFPVDSHTHLPTAFHSLMTREDSPIADFYPTDFVIDLNGKKYAWQGVALLPFVDEERLLRAVEPLYGLLNEEEMKRNERGCERLFVSNEKIMGEERVDDIGGTARADGDPDLSVTSYPSPLGSLPDIPNPSVRRLLYFHPTEGVDGIHLRRLAGSRSPDKRLDRMDFLQVRTGRRGAMPPSTMTHSMHRELFR